MKIEVKEESREGKLIRRAIEYFGYKNPTQFILEAIKTQYRVEVAIQIEKAAKFKNRELEENPDEMDEILKLQGLEG
jgi:hypothetical protein